MALELGTNAETLTIGGILSAFAVAYARDQYIKWAKGRPEVSAASAADSQFKVLQEQIEAQSKRLANQEVEFNEMRAEISRMNKTIHTLQIKFTRAQTALIKHDALAREHGIPVPPHVQAETEQLINPETTA